MIIDAKTIVLTLLVVAVAFYFGLKFVRAFALSIARENHDAVLAMDQADQEKQRKREHDADVAAKSAFAKVQPLLTVPKGGDGANIKPGPSELAPAPSSAPLLSDESGSGV